MFDQEDFTPRNVTKGGVSFVIQHKVAQAVKRAIADRTRFEDDETVVALAGHLVGACVAGVLKPLTDGAVDRVADWYVARVIAKNEAPKK